MSFLSLSISTPRVLQSLSRSAAALSLCISVSRRRSCAVGTDGAGQKLANGVNASSATPQSLRDSSPFRGAKRRGVHRRKQREKAGRDIFSVHKKSSTPSGCCFFHLSTRPPRPWWEEIPGSPDAGRGSARPGRPGPSSGRPQCVRPGWP